jgi:hypothetical protein
MQPAQSSSAGGEPPRDCSGRDVVRAYAELAPAFCGGARASAHRIRAREPDLRRTFASPRRSHPVGRGSRRRPPARPSPRRLGELLRDVDPEPAWVSRIGPPIGRTTPRRVRPQIRLIRPCSCGRAPRSLVDMPICRHLSQSFGPRDWATKGATPSDETTQLAYLQAFQETGATGLEPATSGVTGWSCRSGAERG